MNTRKYSNMCNIWMFSYLNFSWISCMKFSIDDFLVNFCLTASFWSHFVFWLHFTSVKYDFDACIVSIDYSNGDSLRTFWFYWMGDWCGVFALHTTCYRGRRIHDLSLKCDELICMYMCIVPPTDKQTWLSLGNDNLSFMNFCYFLWILLLLKYESWTSVQFKRYIFLLQYQHQWLIFWVWPTNLEMFWC